MIVLGLLLACAQEPVFEAEAGFSGAVFPDAWNRVTVTLGNDKGTLEGTLRVIVSGYRAEPVVYRCPLSLPAPSRKRFVWDVFMTGREDAVDVQVLDPRGKPLRQMSLSPTMVKWGQHRILEVGAPGTPIPWGTMQIKETGARVAVDRFPDGVLPLLGVDVIVFQQPEPLTPGQEEALRRWIDLGGTLVFGAGPSPAACRQGKGKGKEQEKEKEKEEEVEVPLATGTLRRGNAFFSLGGQPAGIRYPRRRGEVVFLTFPFARLHADGVVFPAPFWGRILAGERPTVRGGSGSYEEMDSFLSRLSPQGVKLGLASLGTGFLAVIVYVGLISPRLYRYLRRRGRLKRGWDYFGVVTASFTAFFLLWGAYFSPREVRLTRLVFADEGLVRSFTVVRAADSRVHEFESREAVSPVPAYFGFSVENLEDGPTVEPGRLLHPIPVLETRGQVSARWAGRGEVPVACRRNRASGRLEVTNGGAVPLKDCLLVSEESVYRLGDVGPGTRRSIALTEAQRVAFPEWARSFYKKRLTWRTGPWSFGRQLAYEDPPPELVGFQEAFRRAVYASNPTNTWGYAAYRPRQRGLDLTPWLERGFLFLVGSWDADLSGVRPERGVRAEVRCIVRLLVEEAEE